MQLLYAKDYGLVFTSYVPKNLTFHYNVEVCHNYTDIFNIRYMVFIYFIHPFTYDSMKIYSNIPLKDIVISDWNELDNTLVIEANTRNITYWNLTVSLTNFRYTYYPLYSIHYFYPVLGEDYYSIMMDNIIKVYYKEGRRSISEYLECNAPIYYNVIVKSPTLSQAIYYNRRGIMLALLYLGLIVSLVRYILPYAHAFLNLYKLKKTQKDILIRIRKIEEDYFHRRISDKMFNELIKEEQHKYYHIQAKIARLKRVMKSWEILKFGLQKKKS